jgi:hypothetical protein
MQVARSAFLAATVTLLAAAACARGSSESTDGASTASRSRAIALLTPVCVVPMDTAESMGEVLDVCGVAWLMEGRGGMRLLVSAADEGLARYVLSRDARFADVRWIESDPANLELWPAW